MKKIFDYSIIFSLMLTGCLSLMYLGQIKIGFNAEYLLCLVLSQFNIIPALQWYYKKFNF